MVPRMGRCRLRLHPHQSRRRPQARRPRLQPRPRLKHRPKAPHQLRRNPQLRCKRIHLHRPRLFLWRSLPPIKLHQTHPGLHQLFLPWLHGHSLRHGAWKPFSHPVPPHHLFRKALPSANPSRHGRLLPRATHSRPGQQQGQQQVQGQAPRDLQTQWRAIRRLMAHPPRLPVHRPRRLRALTPSFSC
jgi:hypothetical protein